MKAQELRIGNWVKHYSEWSNRQPENGPFLEFDFQWTETDWYSVAESCLDLEKVKPIQLDKEWVIKLGWVWNDECRSFEKFPNGDVRMNLQFHPVNSSFTMFNYVIKALIAERIFYVHQLQNLCFALNGEEVF